MQRSELKHQSEHQPVAVIGAGVVGTLVAYFLARQGLPVLVVERDELGRGASGHTVPWINASGKRPRAYFDLCVESIRLWAQIAADAVGEPWYRQTGNLHWAADDAWQQTLVERSDEARSWGYESRLLTAAEVAELQPGLDLSTAVGPAVFYPQEGVVHPLRMLREIKARTVGLGASWRFGSAVVGFEREGKRISALVLDMGERVPVSDVVICAGMGTNKVLDLLGARVRMVEHDALGRITSPEHRTYATAHGLIVEIDDNPTGIGRIVHAPGITILPSESGGLLLHSGAVNRKVTLQTPMDPPPDVAAEVLATAVCAVPALAKTKIKRAVLGTRPIPLDGLPAVGRVPATSNCHVAVSHSAMTVGPALGAAVTRSLSDGEPVPEFVDAGRLMGEAA